MTAGDPRNVLTDLRQFADEHYLHLPEFVDRPLLNALMALADQAEWCTLPVVDGPVSQVKEEAPLTATEESHQAFHNVVLAITHAVQATEHQDWHPTESIFNRYLGPRSGITAHRDSRRYRDVIAILTISGHATFAIHPTRTAHPIATWTVRPGDLVLLRGARPGKPDDRPFHSVNGPPTGTRIALTLRRTHRPTHRNSS